MLQRSVPLALLPFLALGLSACSGTPTGSPGATQDIALDLQPLAAQVVPSGTVNFAGLVTGTADTLVVWEVVEATGGTIDSGGHYTAPVTTGLYHVKASSHANPLVQDVAAVTVTQTPVVAVSVSPSSPSISVGTSISFTAIVTGTSNTAVTWSVQEASGCGSVTQAGVYTAPPSPNTCHVVATSIADPSKSAVAAVTVTVATTPPPAAACATAPLRSTGTVYYYCDCQAGADGACVAGNDANTPCTNPAAPCRTMSAAATRFNSMSAGNTVALCRGGAWSGGSVTISNGSCGNTESTYCDFRAYPPSWGSQSTARPYWQTTGHAVSLGGYGNRLWNLNLRISSGSSMGITANGSGNNPDYLDICDIKVDGAGMSGSVQLLDFTANNSNLRHITVRYSEFRNAPFAAITGSYSGLTLDSNLFQDNGLNGSPQDHHIYIATSGQVGGANHDIQLINNRFVADSRCGGVMNVNETHVDNLSIINNSFYSSSTNPNCYAIQISSSNSMGAYSNARILRNRVTMANTTGIALACCANCTLSDNICVGCSGMSIDSGSGGGAGCDNGGSANGIVENNTVYSPSGSGSVGNTGNGGVLASNAVWNASSGGCFDVGNATQAGNYCRAGSGAAVGSVFVDAPNGDFTPVSPGPLIGTGSSTYFSPTAIGSVAWSPDDLGSPRSAPIDAGALLH